ncbi:MAG: response regulator [Nitrospirae bacterium]|nr:response regulator [Nitrospirota bacterium]
MGKQILIVDDCSTTRKLLSIILKGRGYATIAAENGIDALEKLAQHAVDLVVTDLNMPQMDGLELIRTIRGNADMKNLPVVMVTTESDEMDKKRGIEMGASAYLTKPVTKDRLAYEVAKLL